MVGRKKKILVDQCLRKQQLKRLRSSSEHNIKIGSRKTGFECGKWQCVIWQYLISDIGSVESGSPTKKELVCF
jgi:hypothetical protein